MSQTVRARPHHPIHHYPPWRDRSGRFSPLKTATLVLATAPAVWLAAAWASHALGPEPLKQVIHGTGQWAIRFLMLSLVVTPLRTLFNWHRVVLLRRLLGVTSLFYALAHLVLYADDQKWILLNVASEIALRFYLTIGFVALLGLVVLGITSTEGWVRRLGKRWKKLHRIVYGLAALAAFHFFLQSKADVSEATLMAGLFIWLMGWRALPAGPDRQPLPVLGLAVAAGLLTVAVEYVWFALGSKIPPLRPVLAELNVDYGLHPGGQVLVGGLCMAAAVSLEWAKQRERLHATAAFHVALYVAGPLMAAALIYAFSLGIDAGDPAWWAAFVWPGLLGLLGLARWRLPPERRGWLDVVAGVCLSYYVVTAVTDNPTAALAVAGTAVLAALTMAVRLWPVSRASALLVLPATIWIGYAAATMP